VPLDSRPKNPVKVRAGALGALARWGGEPHILRLDTLTPEQRRLVMALVDAARSAPPPVPATE
jgi:hypothetical protein